MLMIEASDEDMADSHWALTSLEASKSPLKSKVAAAVLDKKNRVIALSHNTLKTHPVYGSKPPYNTLHAEGAVLYFCKRHGINPVGMTMIVYRQGKRGKLNSKPCPCCQRLIRESGIKKVIYTW
jgi:deoxycytidylate deaminase